MLLHTYSKLPKTLPLLFAHYFEGGGVCSNINFVSYIVPPAVPHTIAMTAVAFWMNGSFDERVQQEISGACVETKLRGIDATCIVSGNKG